MPFALHMPLRGRSASLLPLLALLLASLGCGGAGPAPAALAGPAPSGPRSDDPRLHSARRALEEGRLPSARELVELLGESVGIEGTLLGARLAQLEGDLLEAYRLIELARGEHPADGRVYATAAEVNAWAGHLEAAEDEIRRGLAVAGESSELERARGVYMISRSGGALAGLEHLERARSSDPQLPFLRQPLAQAYLLVGRHHLGLADPMEAARHARAGQAIFPDDLDLLELEADAAAGVGHFSLALELYAELELEGLDYNSTIALLLQRHATALMLEGERSQAVERYLEARARGLSEDDLGFGVNVLREEAETFVELGYEALEGQDLTGAEVAFRRAILLDPGRHEARSHLARTLYLDDQLMAACDLWQEVLDGLHAEGEPLPEPVHLYLAQTWTQLGLFAEARRPLEAYLAAEPEGAFVLETESMLELIPAADEDG